MCGTGPTARGRRESHRARAGPGRGGARSGGRDFPATKEQPVPGDVRRAGHPPQVRLPEALVFAFFLGEHCIAQVRRYVKESSRRVDQGEIRHRLSPRSRCRRAHRAGPDRRRCRSVPATVSTRPRGGGFGPRLVRCRRPCPCRHRAHSKTGSGAGVRGAASSLCQAAAVIRDRASRPGTDLPVIRETTWGLRFHTGRLPSPTRLFGAMMSQFTRADIHVTCGAHPAPAPGGTTESGRYRRRT
jgi:hypothetical protein